MWDRPPGDLSIILLSVAAWTFPIGSLVLRRHFVNATGWWLVVKVTMYSLAWLSAPLALFTVLLVISGAFDAFEILSELLKALL